ncbi:MAG TPA: putative glycoside hydrolase [Candidatus Limnocylindria bacterium]|nr:putative glycoside hydrolase [Candidatus Limnocylindria bacterium]
MLTRTRSLPAVLAALVLLAACGENGPFPVEGSPTPVPPREVAVTAVDRATGDPIAGATISVGGTEVAADETGSATLTAPVGAPVAAVAAGYEEAVAPVPVEGALEIGLRDTTLEGTVTDAAGEPLFGVDVFVDEQEDGPVATTDEDGAYLLTDVPESGTVIFKRAGYRLGEIQLDEGAPLTLDVAMEPFSVRALYAPSAVFEAPGRLDQLLELIDATEANAMVIDVKETDGKIYWATDLPEAVEAGAVRDNPLFDLEELLPQLKERGIYTIARMVSMKDNTTAAARPELAVINRATGEPWRDNIGGAWLDPSAPGVGEYLAALAGDLADKGFDEVQLDYIRFYSDGPYELAETNLPNTQSFRLPAIERVLRVVSTRLQHERAFLAADVFPISFIVPDDQGIGQRPEVIMPFVDYFCPMVYPSHYGPGVFGYDVPNNFPYEVIDETLQIMNRQAEGLPISIRPWIQDFGYGAFPPYSAAQVRAEMQAVADNGGSGWMIWNARATFTVAALGPPREGEDAGPVTVADPAASVAPSASP